MRPGMLSAACRRSCWPARCACRRSRHGRVVERLRALAERAESDGARATACRLYRWGLEIDELEEAFYRGLMRCLAALQEHGQVASLYRRCERLLTARLGVAPSGPTRQLYLGLTQPDPSPERRLPPPASGAI